VLQGPLRDSRATCSSVRHYASGRWQLPDRRDLRRLFLKAGSAQDRPALGRLERHGCGLPARGTRSPRLRANPPSTGTFRLALLAVLGIVLELFVVEEKLFSGGEHKLRAAVIALQHSVCEFHDRFPRNRDLAESAIRNTLSVPIPRFRTSFGIKGPGRHKFSGSVQSSSVPRVGRLRWFAPSTKNLTPAK
jgi:hypothetical protein